MDKYKLDLSLPYNQVEIRIIHKDIKNVHLKVFRDLKVILSVPIDIPDDWIVNFLEQRKGWIAKQLVKYKQSSGYNSLFNVKSGTSTQLLGQDRRIIKKESLENYVEEDEKNIILYLKNIDEEGLSQRLIGRWWREKANKIYGAEMDALYEKIFRKYNIAKPNLQIKKMKTLWGSCTPAKNKVTLNEYLLKADLRCIQYVILHELTHLLYPYHNKEFYAFLTIQMPDWKVRKEQLDREVVQGL